MPWPTPAGPALTHHVCSALRHVALVPRLLVDEEAIIVLHAAMVGILVGSNGASLLQAVGAQHVLVADVRCHGDRCDAGAWFLHVRIARGQCQHTCEVTAEGGGIRCSGVITCTVEAMQLAAASLT